MSLRGASSATVRTMRARVLTAVDGGADEYGHTRQEGTDVTYDALPCYAWVTTEKSETFGEATQGAVEILRLVVDADTEIDTRSVIESVTDRRGKILFPGPTRVIGVTRRAEHLVVNARAITGGRA